MKKITSIYILVSLLLFNACSNDLPEFDDKDAYIAFTSSSMNVDENGGSLNVPVLLTSLSGISSTVEFRVNSDASTAVQGIHYRILNSSNSLSFTKDAPTQYIQLEIIDNDTFDGDVSIRLELFDPKGVNLGAENTCTVKIEDDEHPLLFILGRLTARGQSIYDDFVMSWEVLIEKDDEDANKVWLTNFVPGANDVPIYGTVNDDKTEIRIPVGQKSDIYGPYDIVLDGYYNLDEEDEEEIAAGGYILGLIDEDGLITIQEAYGSAAYEDDEYAGHLELMLEGVTMKK